MQPITANDHHVVFQVGKSAEVRIGQGASKAKIWVRRDPKWIPTVINGLDHVRYLRLTNLADRDVILNHGSPLSRWMCEDMVPRSPGYVSVGSCRYNEWYI